MAQETLDFHVKPRGFAALSVERRREIASQGGRAAHDSGHAHQYTTESARQAGSKGGRHHSREHMAQIGRRGGIVSGATRRGETLDPRPVAARKSSPFELVIHLEDSEREGVRLVVHRMAIVEAQPLHSWAVAGLRLARVPRVGEFAQFKRRRPGQHHWLLWSPRYRVTQIERRRLKPEEAAPCPA